MSIKKNTSLPVDEIKHMLDEGMRQVDVALLFNVSQTTISRLYAIPHKSARKNVKDANLCSCCQQRPIAKGNRLLCLSCYKAHHHEEHMAWA